MTDCQRLAPRIPRAHKIKQIDNSIRPVLIARLFTSRYSSLRLGDGGEKVFE